MAEPQTFQIDEQESGYYIGILTDNDGVTMIPGATLLTLRLTLYVIQQDGTIAYLNSRNQQDVLNLNNVLVYDTLQTDANGRSYNLRWTIQPADTTLVEDLPQERHIGLFEWTWSGGAGKQEFVLSVKNLTTVT